MTSQPGTLTAALAYAALSIVLTWPLASGLASDVPGDLGDSVLNMWILAWGAEHVPRLLTGAMSWPAFWNGNIFHPEPLALTFSEHLFGQTLQILPVYWLTGNIILCYNLIFLSTFGLSALGTYLLVRDLTGDRRAAFLAGLVYGFLPYRIASVPHVQVMSAQWMPFALYGLNRFVAGSSGSSGSSGSLIALAGGTAALVMQNWSCGYYLLYFAPFVPLFVIHRMWTLGTLKVMRTWIWLGAAAAVTVVLTLPFLLPYADAKRMFGFERPFGEVVQFSANVWSYVTASENLWLFGKALRYYPHGEGETFLGFVPWILAVVALLGLLTKPGVVSEGPPAGRPTRFRFLTILLTIAVITQLVALASAVIFGGFDIHVLGVPISARTPRRLLLQLVVATMILFAVSPESRAGAARLSRTPQVFLAVATILAVWFSLGPLPYAGNARVSGFGLYGVLYDYVPGFNGVRVPARYAMIAGLFLAVLSGFGAAEILRFRPLRRGGSSDPPVSLIATALAALLILAEGAAIPMGMNHSWAQNEATPPARVYPAAHAPPVYARVALLPAGSAITEFPFGDAAWEIRYVYYAHSHWKPITNGYSGVFPPAYKARLARLRKPDVDPEAAWRALADTGTTHVVLHPVAFANPADAAAVEAWLRARHASEIQRFPDGDLLFELPKTFN